MPNITDVHLHLLKNTCETKKKINLCKYIDISIKNYLNVYQELKNINSSPSLKSIVAKRNHISS